MIIHILHKDSESLRSSFKMLCNEIPAHEEPLWIWKDLKGDWVWKAEPICQVCLLLAMSEPENIYQENHE